MQRWMTLSLAVATLALLSRAAPTNEHFSRPQVRFETSQPGHRIHKVANQHTAQRARVTPERSMRGLRVLV
jgi:hypothetical protein